MSESQPYVKIVAGFGQLPGENPNTRMSAFVQDSW
jgi:hypothetical protein